MERRRTGRRVQLSDNQFSRRRFQALIDGFVNGSGTVVGIAAQLPSYSEHGFFVRNNIPRNFAETAASFLPAANNNMNTIVGTLGNSGYMITATGRSTVNYPGVGITMLSGVNAAGDVVGSARDNTHSEFGFVLSQGNFTTIAPPTSLASGATAINDSGQVIGAFLDGSNPASNPAFLATPN